MNRSHQIIPIHDATSDVTDWWRDTIDDESDATVTAIFETSETTESYATASGPNGYRHVEHDMTLHYFLGLTVEGDDTRFIPLEAFLALGVANGFDASGQIGTWQNEMDERE